MSEPSPERIHLHHVEGARRGDVDSFCQANVVIGRSRDCDVVFENESVTSSHHAVIRQANGQFELVDSHGTNGTFVNDARVEKRLLEDGDLIQFGVEGPVVRVALPSQRDTKTTRRLFAPLVFERAPERAAEPAMLSTTLSRRRHVRFVRNATAIYIGGAIAVTQLADLLISRYGWPRDWFTGILTVVIGGFLATLVASGFRGAPGTQRTRPVEVLLHLLVVTATGAALWHVLRR